MYKKCNGRSLKLVEIQNPDSRTVKVLSCILAMLTFANWAE